MSAFFATLRDDATHAIFCGPPAVHRFPWSDSTPNRAETTRHAAFPWLCVPAHRQKRSNLRKDHNLEVFATTAKPIEALCPRFSSPVAGAAYNKAYSNRAAHSLSNNVQSSALTASLADLNSYNKPLRVAQAKRQTFFQNLFQITTGAAEFCADARKPA